MTSLRLLNVISMAAFTILAIVAPGSAFASGGGAHSAGKKPTKSHVRTWIHIHPGSKHPLTAGGSVSPW
jgi:hypothetical protein